MSWILPSAAQNKTFVKVEAAARLSSRLSSGRWRRAEPRPTVWLRKHCKSVPVGRSSEKNEGKGEDPEAEHT